MSEQWGRCLCGDGPEHHEMVVIRPVCIDPGNRVLFEGTLGRCLAGDDETWCACEMFSSARLAKEPTP